jgi:hypothetical protein|tara:strand:+ start:252 stop:404 length:153 start_codon:yes stop_codon:yes gene_type:complete
LATFIYICGAIVFVYVVGVWVGTRLEKALEADRVAEAKAQKEKAKAPRRR